MIIYLIKTKWSKLNGHRRGAGTEKGGAGADGAGAERGRDERDRGSEGQRGWEGLMRAWVKG